MNKVYVIDACALIDAQKNYDMSKKVFRPIWNTFDELIKSGQLISSSEIQDELKDDDLICWAKEHKDMFVPLTKDIQEKVVEVLGKYPTIIKMTSTSNSNGDPFLVATAIIKNGCVVTNERSGDEKTYNYRIPNVCKAYNIECIKLRDFLSRVID